MSIRQPRDAAALALALAWPLALLIPRAGLAADAPKNDRADPTTAMTFYGQGAAVVEQRRRMTLDKGTQTLRWPVAARPQGDTVSLYGHGIRLQGFRLNAAAATGLSARIGQTVSVAGPGKTQEGRLVALQDNAALVRIDDRIQRYALDGPAVIGWPAAGADASGNESLALQVDADAAGPQALVLRYQRAAPAWQASYTGVFDADKQTLTLNARAVIDNTGQTAIDADRAWLVAGQLQRAPQPIHPMMMAAKARSADTGPAGAPESVGGLYRYPLKDGLHVPAGATLGVSLMAPVTLATTRETRLSHYAMDSGSAEREHAERILHAKNTAKTPLPTGVLRVYDAQATAQLLGEDTIDDTPIDAPLDLELGQAFDISATRHVTTDTKARTRRVTMTLYNATDTARQVTVVERLPDGARLAEGGPAPAGQEGGAPMWRVNVPAGGQTDFSYRFQLPADG